MTLGKQETAQENIVIVAKIMLLTDVSTELGICVFIF